MPCACCWSTSSLAADRVDAALIEVAALLEASELPGARAVSLGRHAVARRDLQLAERLTNLAESTGQLDGVADLRASLDTLREERGVVTLKVVDGGDTATSRDRAAPERVQITFEQVGGLADLKRVVHRKIILPFTRPDLLKRYGKRAGGGVLLYGPPGCGKTLMARATAGECGLPFFVVRIDEILSAYVGRSERNLRQAFEHARANAPCMMFLDELDALGFARSRMQGEHHRGLVDQLLQELDGMADANDNVLVLAATNAPWDLDDALLRPGRFDRTLFVPPPDAPAREEILRIHLEGRPIGAVDLKDLAGRTERFSGADLRALVERAFDEVVEEALQTGTEPPAESAHFVGALAELRPSTGPWLERARNYVEFANQDQRYDDVARYLGISKGWKLF